MHNRPTPRIDDIDLGAAVAAALQRNALLPCTIFVEVCYGVVKLRGDVEDVAQRQEAEAVVRRFRGVADVINDIAVVPPS